jgi:hypothetical protein
MNNKRIQEIEAELREARAENAVLRDALKTAQNVDGDCVIPELNGATCFCRYCNVTANLVDGLSPKPFPHTATCAYTLRQQALSSPSPEAEDLLRKARVIDTMESLRQQGWIVKLGCIPDDYPWLVGDDWTRDPQVKRTWSAEASYIKGRDSVGPELRKFFAIHPFALKDDPLDAVLEVSNVITREEQASEVQP